MKFLPSGRQLIQGLIITMASLFVIRFLPAKIKNQLFQG